jgi:hypothetical protein
MGLPNAITSLDNDFFSNYKTRTMKKKLTNKIDPILALITFILLFLAQKGVLPNPIYYIVACLIAFYFFPIKIILQKVFIEEGSKVLTIFSFLTVAAVIDFSIIYLFVSSDGMLATVFGLVSIINIGFAYFYIFRGRNLNLAILHLSISFVSGAALFA